MTPVKLQSDKCKEGELIDVKITSFDKNGLFGTHVNNKEEKAA